MTLKDILIKKLVDYKAKNLSSVGLTMGEDGIKRAEDIITDIQSSNASDVDLFNETLALIKTGLGSSKQLRKYLAQGLCQYLGITEQDVRQACLEKKYWRLQVLWDPIADTNTMLELIEKQVKTVGINMRVI